MSFDYTKFINEGFEAQEKYAVKIGAIGPTSISEYLDKPQQKDIFQKGTFRDDFLGIRYEKIIEYFGHMIEEAIEARVYVPRRSWKNKERSYMDSPELRKEFIAEMYDVLLFHRAILAYAGVTGEEFAEVAAQKQAYNQVRPDHNVNGTAEVTSNPSEELHGNCPSASF